MNVIVRIAWLEARSLFYSPIAWLLLVAFILPVGMTFASQMLSFDKNILLFSGRSLTMQLFSNPISGIFTEAQASVYFYIPLLTMGLISRELASGSIKLLYSSPISVTQIVLGKYCALLAYGLLLIAAMALFVVAASVSIESADITLTMSGLLGLFLLIAAYVAIGLFMSCLTSHQVVAAVSTLIVLASLNYVGRVGQEYDLVRDLTYFLSIAGRSGAMLSGLISSKDVAYFLIIIGLFLGFSILKLQSAREVNRPAVVGVRYAAVLGLALTLGYLTSHPMLWAFHDMTRTKENTLTAASQAVLAKMPKPMKLTTYVNLLDSASDAALPRNRNDDLQFFERYLRFKPEVQMRYVYYYDEPLFKRRSKTGNSGVVTVVATAGGTDSVGQKNIQQPKVDPKLSLDQVAQKVADNENLDLKRFVKPEQIRALIDLNPEQNTLVRQIEYDGKRTFLRMFDDPRFYPSEAEITAALERLIVKPPKVAFLSGHGERRTNRGADADYSMIAARPDRVSLVNQGFEVMPQLVLAGRPVPADVSVLVIASPTEELGADAQPIRDYLARGGNALIVTDPGSRAIVNPLLSALGVQYMEGSLSQENDQLAPDFLVATLDDAAVKRTDTDHGLFDARSNVNEFLPDLFSQRRVTMPNAMGILPQAGSPFTFHPAMLAADPPYQADPIPVAVGLTRQINGKEQRLMVTGDADFMSNRELIGRGNVESANEAFALEIFKWLGYGEFPVNTNRPKPADTHLLADRTKIQMMKTFFCFALPGAIAAVGAVSLIRRRRR